MNILKNWFKWLEGVDKLKNELHRRDQKTTMWKGIQTQYFIHVQNIYTDIHSTCTTHKRSECTIMICKQETWKPFNK